MNQDPNLGKEKILTINGVSFAHDDLYRVVDDFYTQIQNDPVLKVPFRSVADWPEHINKLTHFWWVRFGGDPYMFNEYNPVAKHYFAGFNAELLARWLSLFDESLKNQLKPDQAALWKLIAERMGEGLTFKNELFKAHYEAQSGPKKTDR